MDVNLIVEHISQRYIEWIIKKKNKKTQISNRIILINKTLLEKRRPKLKLTAELTLRRF